MENLEKSIGKKLKELRINRGYALRELADRCGLSANAISLIERGLNSPTVSSLKNLSEALGVPVKELFEPSQDFSIVHIKNSRGMKIKKNNFEIENLGYGFPNQRIEPYHLVIYPEVDTSSKVISHPGQEFVYCLTGEINYFIGKEQYHLLSGDSLLFDASYPHGWCNPTKKMARLLLIFHSLDDAHLAHQRHTQDNLEA